MHTNFTKYLVYMQTYYCKRDYMIWVTLYTHCIKHDAVYDITSKSIYIFNPILCYYNAIFLSVLITNLEKGLRFEWLCL